jgi:membrane-associated protease RseP (regulator of RpoE activity)
MSWNQYSEEDRSVVDGGDYVDTEVVPQQSLMANAAGPAERPMLRRRRKKLPLILFLVTCVSTFWVGSTGWLPQLYLGDWYAQQDAMPIRLAIIGHWREGLIYTLCLMGILLTHEMGHFLAALRYRVPASLPFFLPMPISLVGTMGAVIGMDGMRANRREMFDIGLAGPLSGLAVAVPVLLVGIGQLDLSIPEHGPFALDTPLSVRMILEVAPPPGYTSGDEVCYSQLNPYFMAGWVGLLITGLNMLPVGQLDGGHVIYTLFGKSAHWIARGFMLAAIGYIIYAQAWFWILMVILVLLMGTDHPPTQDDTVRLGWFRTALGLVSLSIPLLCFPPQVLKLLN